MACGKTYATRTVIPISEMPSYRCQVVPWLYDIAFLCLENFSYSLVNDVFEVLCDLPHLTVRVVQRYRGNPQKCEARKDMRKAGALFAYIRDSVTAIRVCADPFKATYSDAVAYRNHFAVLASFLTTFWTNRVTCNRETQRRTRIYHLDET